MKLLIGLLSTILFMGIAVSSYGADVELIWDKNTEVDLAGYRLYRSNTTGGPWVQIGNDIPAAATQIIDAGLGEGIFFWTLTAFDDSGLESGYSNECMLKIDLTPPANPTGLRAFIQALIAWLQNIFGVNARVIG